MGGRSLSDTAKKRKKTASHATRIQNAADAYRAELARPLQPGERHRGSRHFAQVARISHVTVTKRAAGGRSLAEVIEEKQKLTPAQELQLVELAENCADRGFPLNHKLLAHFANALLESSHPGCQPVGKNWVDRFLERHRARLQSHRSHALDKLRANAVNPEAIGHWYTDIVYKHVVEPQVPPRLLFGMDEAGFTLGVDDSEVVIGRRGARITYLQSTEDREMVTVLVTICGDGSWLPPLLVFKGKKFQKAWRRNNIANCSFAISPNGWTDSEIAVGYLDIFDELTREMAAGDVRNIFLDNQTSHVAPAFLRLGIERGIKMLSYPPHSTHVAQGLDVVCFAPLKRQWALDVREWERVHGPLKKADFCSVFGATLKKVFTKELILTAWAKTGIHPYNPNAITAEKLAPSKAGTVHGTFPQPQPSPVRAIMAAFSNVHRTAAGAPRETTGQSTSAAEAGAVADTAQADDLPIDPALRTPVRRQRQPLGDLDPALFTPMSRMQALHAGLTDTNVSFLVTPVKVTSAQVSATLQPPVLESLPIVQEPEWSLAVPASTSNMSRPALEHRADELARNLALAQKHVLYRNSIIEDYTAQLVLQNIYLQRVTEALHGKENKEPTTRSYFPKGHGRVLTDPQFLALIEAGEAEKAAEVAEKAKRSSLKERRRTQKEQNEMLWQQMLHEHEEKVTAWQQECAEQRAAGVRVKDLPKRPGRPRRSELPPLPTMDDDGEESADDESDDD